MDSLTEEKKELESVEEKNNLGHEAGGNDWEGDSGDEEMANLPAELSGLNNRTYEFPDDLEADLKNRAFPDLFFVLDPKTRKPRLRTTTGAHDKITIRSRESSTNIGAKTVGELLAKVQTYSSNL
eukprot:scaffold374_cov160-Amphora_coffeaeformis.AAC.12